MIFLLIIVQFQLSKALKLLQYTRKLQMSVQSRLSKGLFYFCDL